MNKNLFCIVNSFPFSSSVHFIIQTLFTDSTYFYISCLWSPLQSSWSTFAFWVWLYYTQDSMAVECKKVFICVTMSLLVPVLEVFLQNEIVFCFTDTTHFTFLRALLVFSGLYPYLHLSEILTAWARLGTACNACSGAIFNCPSCESMFLLKCYKRTWRILKESCKYADTRF